MVSMEIASPVITTSLTLIAISCIDSRPPVISDMLTQKHHDVSEATPIRVTCT